ncbi:hypothetical protein EV675_3271 [Pigmentiphaga kullae]|uniref:Uncharacterized protein n=1 Tax=Pigmentiphaga kullae TaxID=151784 RepID=A0A4Q7NCI5_9BURK|nr:hypothetical protein EV675_3271 [Pigmentiphaga kullae]
MSVDGLLVQRYDRRLNNCLHFAALAWERLTGDRGLVSVREDDIAGMRGVMRRYLLIKGPTAVPSIVLLDTLSGEPHIGVCYRRRLLHLTEAGASFFPFDLAASTYRNPRFYVCR